MAIDLTELKEAEKKAPFVWWVVAPLIEEIERLREEHVAFLGEFKKLEDEADDMEACETKLRTQLSQAREALSRQVDYHRQHARDEFGDLEKAESWHVVIELRKALRSIEESGVLGK